MNNLSTASNGVVIVGKLCFPRTVLRLIKIMLKNPGVQRFFIHLQAAAELKAKQEADAKAAAELKAKQEADAKAIATKRKTITCVKGKTTKKVKAIKPKCPTGYKLKK